MIMEITEPTFVPEWLKSNGSLTTTSHQSSLHSDEKSALKSLRNKSLDNDLGRATNSSYFRSSSSSNGRSYSSFGRNHNKNKERAENWHRDYSAKRVESWSWKLAPEKAVDNNGKVPFERAFPSFGAEEKQVDSVVERVPSPVLSSVIGGDVWTSALAEVPMVVGTNGPSSTSETTNVAASLNMAKTLAQGYPHAQTAPQLSVGTQRLEELAVRQSRQLIPMTPSMPKGLALNSSDKQKIKVSHMRSPRPMSANADVTKTSSSPSSSSSSSTVGKLHVLKPSRERNTTTPIIKEILSPTGGSKLPNSPLAVPLARKAEKRPSPQAKSRNDFFNLMRKKSMANNSSSPVSPDTRCSESANDNPGEGGGENKVDLGGDRKNDLRFDAILYSEEEEAKFLRSLGWEETTEEGGLTEEEINSFYRDVSKYVNSRMVFKGTKPKCLMPLSLQMGKNGGDTKVDS